MYEKQREKEAISHDCCLEADKQLWAEKSSSGPHYEGSCQDSVSLFSTVFCRSSLTRDTLKFLASLSDLDLFSIPELEHASKNWRLGSRRQCDQGGELG